MLLRVKPESLEVLIHDFDVLERPAAVDQAHPAR